MVASLESMTVELVRRVTGTVLARIPRPFERKTVASISGKTLTMTDGTKMPKSRGLIVRPGDEIYAFNNSRNPDAPTLMAFAVPDVDTSFGVHVDMPMVTGDTISNIERGFGARDTAPGTYTMAANRVNFTPIYIPHTATFDRIGTIIHATVASSKIRVGIFTFDRIANVMTRVFDGGEVDGNVGTNFRFAPAISVTLDQGWYWLATMGQNAPQIKIWSSPVNGLYLNDVNFLPIPSVINTSIAYGAFPATITPTSISGSMFPVVLRVA